MAFVAPDDELDQVSTPQGGFEAPDTDVKTAIPDLVKDDNFEPISYALETGDVATAKEVAWQKKDRPWTLGRVGNLAKRFGSAAVDIVSGFGAGLGEIGVDTYALTQPDDADFWKNQGIDPQTAATLKERARTQQVARAQLIEQNAKGFLGKLFNRDKANYITSLAAGGEKRDPRVDFDTKFDSALAQAKKAQDIQSGNVQDDGIVAAGLGAVDYGTRRFLGGELPDEIAPYKASEEFATPEELAAQGAPVDPESVGSGAIAGDPTNLLPLQIPKVAPIATKVASGVVRAAAAPLKGLGNFAVDTASQIPKVSGREVLRGFWNNGVTSGTIRAGAKAATDIARPAARVAGKGIRVVGEFLDDTGKKIVDPKYVTAAEKAAAQDAIETGSRGFLSDVQNLADFQRVVGKTAQGALSAPISVAPLNAFIADNPEEFAQLEGGAAGFGALAGVTGYNPVRGFQPETIQAIDSVLQEQGAQKKYGTPLDAAHDAFMENVSPEVREGVNAYRGFFDGFKLPNGKQPEIYVLSGEQFAAEAAKDAGVSPELAINQRGFKGSDGRVIINGDYGNGRAVDAPDTLGHESGGHVAQSIMELIGPDISRSLNQATEKGLIENGKPTEQLRKFVDAYNEAFDPTGRHKEIQTTDHAISEWLAEQGRQALEGQGPSRFAGAESLREKVLNNLGDYFRETFGVTRKFDREEIPAVARSYRDMLFKLGRMRVDPPEIAPEASTPEAPAVPEVAPEVTPEVPAPIPETATTNAPGDAFADVGITQQDVIRARNSYVRDNGQEPKPIRANFKKKVVSQSADEIMAEREGEFDAAFGELVKVARERNLDLPSATIRQMVREYQLNPEGYQISKTEAPLSRFTETTPTPEKPLSRFTDEAPATPESPETSAPELPAVGNEDTGTETVPAPTAEAITAALDQAQTAAENRFSKARKKSPERMAEFEREEKISELSKLLPNEGEGLRRITDEETGQVTYRGDIDPSNPVHAAILDAAGVTPAQRKALTDIQSNKGKGIYVRYKSAEQEGFATGENLDLSGAKRNIEYGRSSAKSRARQQGKITEQDKGFTPIGGGMGSDGPYITGFDHDKFLFNLRSVVDEAARQNIPTGLDGMKAPEQDAALSDAFRKVSENHANGWKGDGSAPLDVFPDSGITVNPDYQGQEVAKPLADVINMALHIRTARPPKQPRAKEGQQPTEGALKRFSVASDRAKEAQGLSSLNKGFIDPSTGETNALRSALEKGGFKTDEQLKNTISNLRSDLIVQMSESPINGENVHPSGFDITPQDLTVSGTPNKRIAAAGFMPGESSRFFKGEDIARETGLKYDGELPSTRGLPFHQFTDPKTGNSFQISGDLTVERVNARRKEKQEKGFMPDFSLKDFNQDDLGFYSQLAKTVASKVPNRASSEQILATIKSAGVKAEEIDFMGLPEWLASQDGPVSKSDLQEFISQGGVQLQEVTKKDAGTQYDKFTLPGGENYREILLTLPDSSGPEFRSKHWDEPNVIAHIRQSDFQDVDGNSVRLIEELQSDSSRKTKEEREDDKELPKRESSRSSSLPFKKSWHELAFKRALRMAVEDGVDSLAWTTGETQSQRYKKPETGLKALYDQIIPSFAKNYVKKWGGAVGESEITGYSRKTWVKNEDGKLQPFNSKMFAQAHIEKSGGELVSAPTFKVHSIEITPEMREGIMNNGQPLFMPESRKSWVKRGGKRVYLQRGQDGKFTSKQPLARFPIGALQSEEETPSSLASFAP